MAISDCLRVDPPKAGKGCGALAGGWVGWTGPFIFIYLLSRIEDICNVHPLYANPSPQTKLASRGKQMNAKILASKSKDPIRAADDDGQVLLLRVGRHFLVRIQTAGLS